MPKLQCFLCASDEGVFLDITDDNKQIYFEQFENCSLEKVPTKDKLPLKICHKCAYELRQCSSFVEKYKRNVKTKHKTVGRSNCCNLCLEPQKSETIFDISKDKSSEYNFINKLQKVFNNDRNNYLDKKLICLSCRYIVDLLYDLKIVSLETAAKLNDVVDKDIDCLTLPKIKTRVVTRKTTTTISYTISVSSDTENESNAMTRTRSQIKINNKKLKKKSKSCECDKCRIVIESDDDAHKISKSRVLCTSCWENKQSAAKETEKQASPSSAETKSCKVYLKDVMMDETVKKQKLQKTKKSDEEKVFVAPDESSENNNKSRRVVESAKQDTKTHGQKRSTRSTKSEDEEFQFLPIKKLRSDMKQAKKESVPKTSSNSRDKVKNFVRTSNTSLTRHKRATGSSLSDADVDNKKSVRKKFKAIMEDVPQKADTEVSDELSFNGEISLRKRKITIKTENIVQKKSLRSKRLQTPSTRRTLLAPMITISLSSESDDADLMEKKITAYTCEECGSPYENRFLGLKHRLTHYKQPKLELERVVVEKTLRDEKQTEGAETSETMDDIQMTVEDDEDEATEDVTDLSTSNRSQDNAATADAADKTEEGEEINEDAVEMELVLKETSEETNTDATEQEKENADATGEEKENADVEEQEKENTDSKEGEKENVDAKEQEKENVDAKEQEKENTDSKEQEKESTDAEELEKENTETVVDKSSIAEETMGKGEKRRRTTNRKRKSRATSESASEDAQEKQEQEGDTCKQAESNHKDVENKLEDEQNEEECDTSKKKEKEEEEEVEKETEREEKEIEKETEKEEKEVEKQTEKEREEAEGKERERVEEMEVSKEKIEEKSTSEEEIQEEAIQVEEETSSPKRSPRKVKQSPTKVKQSPKRVKRSPNKLNESNLDEDKDLEVVLDTSDKVELIESSDKVEEIAIEENDKDKTKTDDTDASENAQPEEEESSECAKPKNGEENETRTDDKDKTDSIDVTEEESSEQTKTRTDEKDVSEKNDADDSEVIVEEESPKCTKPASEEKVQGTQIINRISDKPDKVLPKEKDEVIVLHDEPDNKESELNASKQGKTNDSNNVAVEVLQEVIDLASEEVQKRQDSAKNNAEQEPAETLENISREIQNTIDESSKKSVPL